ncbi:hypothetical protein Bbelb_390520 [Branchiostoma belcheri]|nr:hypothetical protein Bbelb_426680 [Branchiostoma belcheri]KAI8483170.1 hypothetical protein Bbelb_390520 [Branchiostoma belcheri]
MGRYDACHAAVMSHELSCSASRPCVFTLSDGPVRGNTGGQLRFHTHTPPRIPGGNQPSHCHFGSGWTRWTTAVLPTVKCKLNELRAPFLTGDATREPWMSSAES